jgi:hypothetical protein
MCVCHAHDTRVCVDQYPISLPSSSPPGPCFVMETQQLSKQTSEQLTALWQFIGV